MNTLTITRSDAVANAVLDNPPANILTIDVINEVNAFVEQLANDDDTRVVVFKSANEQFFSAHLDLNVINGTPEGQTVCVEFSRMIKCIKAMKQLSIALVDGVARGGGNEFVMASDLAYGTENAAFAQPELNVNIPAGGQGGVQFARRMGKNKALQALLRGPLNARLSENYPLIPRRANYLWVVENRVVAAAAVFPTNMDASNRNR